MVEKRWKKEGHKIVVLDIAQATKHFAVGLVEASLGTCLGKVGKVMLVRQGTQGCDCGEKSWSSNKFPSPTRLSRRVLYLPR